MGSRSGICLSVLMTSTLMATGLLATGRVLAQASVPASSSSAAGVALSPSGTHDASSNFSGHLENKPASATEHFTFKEHKKPAYVTDAPGNPVNKNQVLGTAKQKWADGRPPINCSRPPLSPACKP